MRAGSTPRWVAFAQHPRRERSEPGGASADSFVSNPYDPQSLNRYGYVLNNPLRYTDPTGHRACEGPQGECWYPDLPVQGYTSSPIVSTTTPTSKNWNAVVQARNDELTSPAATVTLEERSGSGGVVAWANFGDSPWRDVEDSYWSLQPNAFGEVPEAPADSAGAFVNILEPFAEANYRESLYLAAGVGNVISVAWYSYSAQGLWIPQVSIRNESGLLVTADVVIEPSLGPVFEFDRTRVPSETAVAIPTAAGTTSLAGLPALWPPYTTLELRVTLIGWRWDDRLPYMASIEYLFPSGVSGETPVWSNPPWQQ